VARVFKFFLLFIVVPIIIGAAFAIFLIRRSFPQINGEVHLNGLTAPVEVIRDKFGVPHIYARNRDDLYRAQGYVHAQERFWQMDFWRYTGKGRLSELFGKSQIETDRFLRMMGWARIAQEEVDRLDKTSLAILNAYCEGVNAYLADHQNSSLSLEHGILSFTNSKYKPEKWTPLDSMVWGKVMSWDLGMNLSTETSRARLLKYRSIEQVEELFPPYPNVNPLILPGYHWNSPGQTIPKEMVNSIDDIDQLLARFPLPHDPESGIGSNNWVISGNRTVSGKPLIANDPHLGTQMPSIWYQIHMQCFPKSEDCKFNMAGFSFAGVPGVIIGHNERVAWAFTNIGPDVMDLYVEKINPLNSNQYEVNGSWAEMTQLNEQIPVAGQSPSPVTLRYTRHGPVISDFSKNAKDIHQTASISMPEKYAIALRWTALEPMNTFPAIWRMNLASNWTEFREAASHFDVPSQNILYADVDGNIGYQFPGKVPIRTKGDGRFPVPGWTDEYEWTGYIPFDQLPHQLNPPDGYFATANNAVVSDDSGPLVTEDWDYGWRARRIVEMINSHDKPIDLTAIQSMQSDNQSYNARNILPFLFKIEFHDEKLLEAKNLLAHWNFQQHSDSSAAAIFEAFWKHLLEETFYDELPPSLRPGGGSRWVEVIRVLLQNPNSHWWDNQKTSPIETRDAILKTAFTKAVKELQQTLGASMNTWRWGDLHTVTFRNGSFGESHIRVLELLFNRGPFKTAGGATAVNATSWDASNSYEVTALPSMRMIVDLNDLNNSLAIHTTGQSGHPFHPHYIDMAEQWRTFHYNPMLWERSRVQANAEGTLWLK
jgi:penicillin G amidase